MLRENRESCTVGSFVIRTHPQISLGRSNKENEVGGECGSIGKGKKLYRVLVGKPEGKRPLRRPRRRWEDDIRMDLRGLAWG
jgi:hypothetical protein